MIDIYIYILMLFLLIILRLAQTNVLNMSPPQRHTFCIIFLPSQYSVLDTGAPELGMYCSAQACSIRFHIKFMTLFDVEVFSPQLLLACLYPHGPNLSLRTLAFYCLVKCCQKQSVSESGSLAFHSFTIYG